jgi:hypothetical protein
LSIKDTYLCVGLVVRNVAHEFRKPRARLAALLGGGCRVGSGGGKGNDRGVVVGGRRCARCGVVVCGTLNHDCAGRVQPLCARNLGPVVEGGGAGDGRVDGGG